MRIMLTVLALTCALLISACGGDDNESSTNQNQEQQGGNQTKGTPVANITIGETQFKLTPSTVNVDKSGLIKITAKNNGSIVHALEIDAPQGEVRTPDIQPGQSASIQVNLKPGRYEIFCPVDDHRGLGMRGTLVVASGQGAGGGSSTSTPSQHDQTDDNGSGGGGSGSGSGGSGGDNSGGDGGGNSGSGGSGY